MAKVITLVDDFDGKPIPEGEGTTVRFSLNDDWYEMDLSAANVAKLEKLMSPWTDKAVSIEPPRPEPVSRPVKATTRTKVPGQGRDYLDSVRRWARENGKQVADRGRIAASIVEAYEAAKQS